MTRVLVTGANGFVGRRVRARLRAARQDVRAQVRDDTAAVDCDDVRVTGDLSTLAGPDAWAALLDGVDAVVHLAALTHAGGLRDTASWPRYHAVNVGVTTALAKAAATAGVDAFVQLSSIKVNGERSAHTRDEWQRLSALDPPRPEDNYGRSKWLAEQALAAAAGDMRVTVLRPPLLYGPGVKANLLRLFDAVAQRRPLPFASIDNRRSLLGVDNLADAIVHALGTAPRGVRVYTLADSDFSTPDLIRAVAAALDVEPRLWPCPVSLLRLGGRLAGQSAAIGRLTESLLVDRDQIARDLGWHPPQSAAQSLAATAAWYRACRA